MALDVLLSCSQHRMSHIPQRMHSTPSPYASHVAERSMCRGAQRAVLAQAEALRQPRRLPGLCVLHDL
eukprot:10979162-Alexandrium_andersonii.AAC.1